MQQLTQKQRLRHAAEFQEVFKKGKKTVGKVFSLYIYPNKLDYPRLGIVSSKKAIRLANKRNLFKRIVRESFRKNQHFLSPVDIVVVAHSGAKGKNRMELKANIDSVWQRLAK